MICSIEMSQDSFGKGPNGKKRKLAPRSKPKVEISAPKTDPEVDEFEFTDDLLAEVFQEAQSASSLPEKENNEIDSLIDLDDWIPPGLKQAASRKEETTVLKEPVINIVKTGEKRQNTQWPSRGALTSVPCFSQTPNNRKEMLFSSREFEEDSTLQLRFLKRDVPATKIKELSESAQLVPLAQSLKYTEKKDWFIAGVVSEFAEFKKSGSGRVDLTDLSPEPYSVRFLLFNTAFSGVGKLPVGTIVCISNPTKAKPYKGKEALVVNNIEQILVAGTSRDFGLCSGKKKAGGACRAVVNLKICRYCRFHAIAEYKQQRVAKDLKAASAGVGFSVKTAAAPGLWNAKASLAPSLNPAKRNVAQVKKDRERLEKLNASSSSGTPSPWWKEALPSESVLQHVPEKRKYSTLVETSAAISSASSERPNKKPNVPDVISNPSVRITTPASTLPVPSHSPRMSAAKRKALQFAREHGGISKAKPKAKEMETKEPEKLGGITDEFLAMMKEKPRDPTLLKDAEALERDKRFARLEIVEEIGEKLAATHEVPVRAIRCLVCKKNFHQMPLQCVMNKHGCRIVTGTKRFFECNSCRARTTTLERLPTTECAKCGVWSWKRAGVAANRVCTSAAPLSVRGMEEKFMGSIVNDPNLSLLVPDKE